MSKNFRKKRALKWKKDAKKEAILLSSSGCESDHYVFRSVSRSGSFKPIRRRFVKKEIKNGHIMLKKLTRGRVLITNHRTGDEQVVSKNLKSGITFFNTS